MQTDIPSRSDVETLANIREPGCVSIYIPTNTKANDSERARIEFKNMVRTATDNLRASGAADPLVASIRSSIDDLVDDPDAWRFQAGSVAVFVNGSIRRSYRLPDDLGSACEVSDRFYIKPLLRAVSFPRSAFIVALAQKSVRFIEIAADIPATEITVPGMPNDLESATAMDLSNGRGSFTWSAEDQKPRVREFAQAVDAALRPILAMSSRPLIIAAAEPLASVFPLVCTYGQLADEVIPGNPEERSLEDLADAARRILVGRYAAQRVELKQRFQELAAQDRAVTDVAAVAKAATYKAIDTLLVDVDQKIPGIIDEVSGAVTFDENDETSHYGIVDEVVRRALLSDTRIFAVQNGDIPGGGAMAASLRFPV
ncbi:MAG: hypothetical protein JWQ59_1208 [Cryobacterium sp.]|jgi:hypothetical protein|nr:hypothetical protein [Cryobacterium sp.]